MSIRSETRRLAVAAGRVVLAGSLAAGPMLAGAALARPERGIPGGGWPGPGWPSDEPSARHGDSARRDAPDRQDRTGEGRVQVARFVGAGDAAQLLGHGTVAVTSASAGEDHVPTGSRATFEAAVIDQLIKAGYDTLHPAAPGGHAADLKITRTVLRDAETPRKPVSGAASVSVSNRGTAYGMAVAVDLSKPLPALVSTRMEIRIRDRVSGRALWEGRADIATREGDARWTDQNIATRLADALFDGFPNASDGAAPNDWSTPGNGQPSDASRNAGTALPDRSPALSPAQSPAGPEQVSIPAGDVGTATPPRPM